MRRRVSLLRREFLRLIAAIGAAVGALARPRPSAATQRRGRGRPPTPFAVHTLEILRLEVPSWVEVGVPFSVRVVAADTRGLAAVELTFERRRTVIDAGEQTLLQRTVSLEARQARTGLLEAVAVGPDGSRGEPAVVDVVVATSDVLPGRDDSEGFIRRLADQRYLRRHGTAPVTLKDVLYGANPRAKWLGTHAFNKALLPPWWKRWRADGGGQPFDWESACGWFGGITPAGEVLACWLEQHPWVAQHLVWQDVSLPRGQVTLRQYSQWTTTEKIELYLAFFHAWNWLANGLGAFFGEPLQDPPVNQIVLQDCQWPYTGLTKDQAWKLYLGTVAHSLALEIGGCVPWSVVGYHPEDLETLFDSRSLFEAGLIDEGTADCPFQTQHVGYWADGYVVPAPPTTTFEFLVNENIVQADHYKSIGLLLHWARGHLRHIGGLHRIWKHEGALPVCGSPVGVPTHDRDHVGRSRQPELHQGPVELVP